MYLVQLCRDTLSAITQILQFFLNLSITVSIRAFKEQVSITYQEVGGR